MVCKCPKSLCPPLLRRFFDKEKDCDGDGDDGDDDACSPHYPPITLPNMINFPPKVSSCHSSTLIANLLEGSKRCPQLEDKICSIADPIEIADAAAADDDDDAGDDGDDDDDDDDDDHAIGDYDDHDCGCGGGGDKR